MSITPFMNPDVDHSAGFYGLTSTLNAFFNSCPHKKSMKSSDGSRENCFNCGTHLSNVNIDIKQKKQSAKNFFFFLSC